MSLNWFTSRTVRQARDLCRHVEKILAAQRDILSPPAVQAVETALNQTKSAISERAADETIQKRATEVETIATKWLRPYPNAGIRENVEVLLVALTVAMGIRTFFFQPFKIPTGSMQPTLYGVISENLKGKSGVKSPGILGRIYEGCVLGTFYHYQEAEEDGELVGIGEPGHFLKFINTTSILVHYPSGDKPYTFYMTPEEGFVNHSDGSNRAGIEVHQQFHKGEAIVNFKDFAGDHLFVDRVTYNFRHPQRGEIIVFETHGIGNSIAHLPSDQFYIKRMVAMGDDSVQIGNDRHLVINGKRLDQSTPHFENVYSFDPARKAQDSVYSGHLNQVIADQTDPIRLGRLAPLFPDQNTVYQIPPDHYMVMGDNTANSFDSRAWGDFSRTNVIGKYSVVYWPFTKRFGWGVR